MKKKTRLQCSYMTDSFKFTKFLCQFNELQVFLNFSTEAYYFDLSHNLLKYCFKFMEIAP